MFNYLFKVLDMNGYGVYVWSCYGVFVSLLAWQVVAALRRSVLMQGNLKQELWSRENSDSHT